MTLPGEYCRTTQPEGVAVQHCAQPGISGARQPVWDEVVILYPSPHIGLDWQPIRVQKTTTSAFRVRFIWMIFSAWLILVKLTRRNQLFSCVSEFRQTLHWCLLNKKSNPCDLEQASCRHPFIIDGQGIPLVIRFTPANISDISS